MFEDPDRARQQILRDKHTLLEGYVTEYLFEDQFLKRKYRHLFTDYTTGWWSAEAGEKRFFFLVSSVENDIDRSISEILRRKYEVWRAFPEGNTWHFYTDARDLTLDEFAKEFHLTKTFHENAATQSTRGIARQSRCLAFFEEHDLLQKIALERNFADDILAGYFDSIVNIDFVAESSTGEICVIEVKFKLESKSKTFGINVGQFKMFEIFADMGLRIEHWILYNKTHDKEHSIFGFLELDRKKWWRCGTIDTEVRREQKSAPAETSIQGLRSQDYYEFDADDFVFKAPLE